LFRKGRSDNYNRAENYR
jgi:hypothetical protein